MLRSAFLFVTILAEKVPLKISIVDENGVFISNDYRNVFHKNRFKRSVVTPELRSISDEEPVFIELAFENQKYLREFPKL